MIKETIRREPMMINIKVFLREIENQHNMNLMKDIKNKTIILIIMVKPIMIIIITTIDSNKKRQKRVILKVKRVNLTKVRKASIHNLKKVKLKIRIIFNTSPNLQLTFTHFSLKHIPKTSSTATLQTTPTIKHTVNQTDTAS